MRRASGCPEASCSSRSDPRWDGWGSLPGLRAGRKVTWCCARGRQGGPVWRAVRPVGVRNRSPGGKLEVLQLGTRTQAKGSVSDRPVTLTTPRKAGRHQVNHTPCRPESTPQPPTHLPPAWVTPCTSKAGLTQPGSGLRRLPRACSLGTPRPRHTSRAHTPEEAAQTTAGAQGGGTCPCWHPCHWLSRASSWGPTRLPSRPLKI